MQGQSRCQGVKRPEAKSFFAFERPTESYLTNRVFVMYPKLNRISYTFLRIGGIKAAKMDGHLVVEDWRRQTGIKKSKILLVDGALRRQ